LANLSIILPVYNDYDNFSATLDSLEFELKKNDEVIVIDSSTDKYFVKNCLKKKFLFETKYCWSFPEGVYSAQNKGIGISTNDWVIIINSGDLIELGIRKVIDSSIVKYPEIKMHVFAQLSKYESQTLYKFIPKRSGIWPHQSIVCSKDVYKELGCYNLQYKLISDQIFFLEARKIYKYAMYSNVLSSYDLQGLSSIISFDSSREGYILNRYLGYNPFMSFFKSYIMSLIKLVLIFIIGERKMHKLKSVVSRKYVDC
jgi:glycosyltransferase involved in cell wall biosynthesis